MTIPLNPQQDAAVRHPGGPLLVLAGAGSGKTRVLTARIAHLIKERGLAPQRLFAVTFTNKAAGEMRSRVALLLGADPKGLWIGTFHALSARLLRREAAHLGFGPNFTIYDEDDSESFIKRLLEQRGLSPKANPPRAIHAVISGAKNRMLLPEELGAAAEGPLERVAADIYAALGPALQQANAMDFDDLLLHPLTLFQEHPDRLAYWRRRFEHVLVDEFQDTNAAQYRLVRHLAAEHHNLCVVGDDDQAIYGWRGADVRHMLSFSQDFPGATLIKLEQNYRSTQVILDAANGVIVENTRRLGKTLFTATPGGEPVTLLTAADERDEAEWLATELARRAAETHIPYEGMAILYRTNAQSRPLEEALRFRGIPYRLIGAVSFYERREVKDVLAYLRLIANPADDEAFVRIVNVPRRGIGDASLTQLLRTAAHWGKPLLETARAAERVPELRPNVREAFLSVARLIDDLRSRLGAADPATVLEQVIATVAYRQYLAEEGPEGIERLENVEELIAGAAEWAETALAEEEGAEEGAGASLLERYLTQAALLTPADEGTGRAGAANGVTLMTVHMAKGLEWPVVTLAGLEDGLFPLARAAGEPGGLEEERRLCYVGLTRAREKLYLSWARTRYRNGRLELSEPSRFLEALPGSIIEQRSTTPQWDRALGAGAARGRGGRRAPRALVDVDVDWEAVTSQDAPRYAAGERVRHRKFGSGVIRAVSGSGRELKVTVEFDDQEVGIKQLLVAYAGLEREWESA
ncbi:MAG TPA: UvrD-helicase domain-containing protein [Gemmatimonadales bacterium]|nr:UvrD-helicase domain-containing protein [Gemmatimonadales bacterium]